LKHKTSVSRNGIGRDPYTGSEIFQKCHGNRQSSRSQTTAKKIRSLIKKVLEADEKPGQHQNIDMNFDTGDYEMKCERTGDRLGAFGFIFILAVIFSDWGGSGSRSEERRGRPFLIAIILLGGVAGGYYWMTRPEQPLAVAVASNEVLQPQASGAFCFQAIDGTKGTMIGMDDEKIVIKSEGGKLHTFGNGKLRTVACD
jgi:hypothetical protein